MTRNNAALVDLGAIATDCTIRDRCYAGIQTVSLRQIRGSFGRCHDFDAVFYPRRSHNKGRWLNIAVARQMGVILPLVELIRVENVFFVQDGHHRISVARAMRQSFIEGKVTVWRVSGPLPWQSSKTAGNHAQIQAVEPATTH